MTSKQDVLDAFDYLKRVLPTFNNGDALLNACKLSIKSVPSLLKCDQEWISIDAICNALNIYGSDVQSLINFTNIWVDMMVENLSKIPENSFISPIVAARINVRTKLFGSFRTNEQHSFILLRGSQLGNLIRDGVDLPVEEFPALFEVLHQITIIVGEWQNENCS